MVGVKILVLSSWFPYPPDHGSRIRVYNLLKQLSRCHELSLLSFARDGRGEVMGDLRNLCTSVEIVPWISFSPWRLRAILGFLSPTPRWDVDTYSDEMAQLVSMELEGASFDLILASELWAAPYVPSQRDVPAVFDELQVGAFKDAYETAQGDALRCWRWLIWAKRRRYIGHLVQRFEACAVASAQEKANVQEIVPAYDRVYIIPNGVDVDHYKPGSAQPMPDTLIYTGSLTYSANYDAMAYFLSDILPQIQADFPDVELKITGSTRGVGVDRLPLGDSVIFTGYVDDIRPVVARSWACVVPLRIGGGTRLKILEAMALGTPVISTSKGAQGLEVTPGEDILIADDPAEFAAQTVRILRDPELRQGLAEKGRRLVERKYSWTQIGRRFIDLIESVVQAKRSR